MREVASPQAKTEGVFRSFWVHKHSPCHVVCRLIPLGEGDNGAQGAASSTPRVLSRVFGLSCEKFHVT